jgi:hypothetical protein
MKEITSRTSTVFLVNILSECSPESVVMNNFCTKTGTSAGADIGKPILGLQEFASCQYFLVA